MARVTVVDSGTGNLFSLREAFRRAGASVQVTRSPDGVRDASCLVIPGVASFPSVVHGMKMERLAYGWLSAPSRPLNASDVGLPGGVLGLVTPKRALYAHALSRMDPLFRALERAMGTENREDRARILAEVDTTTSWNPLLNIAVPSMSRSFISRLDLAARYRLVRLALRVEQARGRGGRYPAEATALEVPVDPHAAPAPLRYQAAADGRGYKLWSVGSDGRDDGGKAEGNADLVLERRAAP